MKLTYIPRPRSRPPNRADGKDRLRGRERGRGQENRAVALVVTLVLLSVITFMAVTFLLVSHSEKGQVATTTEQNVALLAADAGQEHVKMQLLSFALAFTNPYNYRMLVSTAYFSSGGFQPGISSPTNVSYNYANGNPLTKNDLYLNLANMLYDPPVPVFVPTNKLGSNEFRFYLDLNRNGVFDPTGLQPVIGPGGQYIDVNGNSPPAAGVAVLSNNVIGDPQWVGIPNKAAFALGLPNSVTNGFSSRYAYYVVPISEALDINYIYNQAKLRGPNQDGFFRNQGVGTWEGNFAAFLVDLNTNKWPYPADNANGARYQYETNFGASSRGAAFDDAREVLRYRYNFNFTSLSNVPGLFGVAGRDAFRFDGIDGYTDGPLMTGLNLTPMDNDLSGNVNSWYWAGSDNVNHYSSLQELFDRSKTARGIAYGFPDRMASAGTNVSSYDRSTYYRLLSQLSTDSEPDPPDRMNINYDNLVQSNRFTGAKSATNFFAWRPVDFFSNAAVRLLVNAGYEVNTGYTNLLAINKLGATNLQIMIYPTNFYTPSVHRLFQLSANIYDATTDRSFAFKNPAGYPAPAFPAVFKPRFQSVNNGNEVYIVGFEEVTNLTILNARTRDLNIADERNNLKPSDMVYGVPLVVGAAKGLPNFNELAMQTRVYATRLLEFRRPEGGDPNVTAVNETNQMYMLGITNAFAVESWNSYTNPYPRELRLIWAADLTASLTNELGNVLLTNHISTGNVMTVSANTWRGWTDTNQAAYSFRLPAATNFTFLTNSTYTQNPIGLVPYTHIFERTRLQPSFPVPRWWLNLNTRLRFILVDTEAERIVDYVNLNHSEDTLDIAAKLAEGADCTTLTTSTYNNPGSQWCTNRLGRQNSDVTVPTYGIMNQILVGLFGADDFKNFSVDPASGFDAHKAVDGFRFQLMKDWSAKYPEDTGKIFYKSNIFYAPLAPYRPIYIHTTWQVNDPLVHYTIGDLLDLSIDQTNQVDFTSKDPPLDNIGVINTRYRPWGGNPGGGSSPNAAITPYNLAAKDAGVTRSDAWDFPTNKLPNVGWLGRIHRGTPWQTLNLKSTNVTVRVNAVDYIDTPRWQRWTGNGVRVRNVGQFQLGLTNWFPIGGLTNDAVFTHPINDRGVLDLFTTAFNDNASRGRMSVNQSGLAAWSAILSGVIVNSNINPDAYTVIQPAGTYDAFDTNTWPPLLRIVNAINDVRATNFGGAFRKLGDILAVPELTLASPYLDLTAPNNNLSDEVLERIPQQILGLLKGSENPRFVVYSYGQSLKPAPNSIVTSGPYFGLCTNYQIMAEVATRAVVRIEGSPDPNRNADTENDPKKRYPPRVIVEKYNVLGPD